MRNVFVFIGGLALLIIGAWFIFTYVLITDEDRIHRLVQKSKHGFESGSILTLSDVFAPGYTDRGGADKAQVLQTLRFFFDATSSRTIQMYSVDIELNEDKAKVAVECKIDADMESGGAFGSSRLNQFSGRRLQIVIDLVKIKQRWKVSYTDVERIG